MPKKARYLFLILFCVTLVYVCIVIHQSNQYTPVGEYENDAAYYSKGDNKIVHFTSRSSQLSPVTEHFDLEEVQSERGVSTITSRSTFSTENEILSWLKQSNSSVIETKRPEVQHWQLQKNVHRQNVYNSLNEAPSSHEQKAVNERGISPAGSSTGDPAKQKYSNSLFSDGNTVRNCLSRDVIGQVPPDLPTQPLRISRGPSVESSTVRRHSFEKVFETRAWGHGWDAQNTGLNVSGMGATLFWTQELTSSLHILINDLRRSYNLTRVRILDVPCGDMAWMSRFLLTRDDIDYTGMDIVPAIIEHHRSAFGHHPWKFILGDILEDSAVEDEDEKDQELKFDIIICRTLAQHLYLRDITRLFKRLMIMGGRVLVTTSFYLEQKNVELINDQKANPGRYRPINLELPPISLVPPQCIVRDGPGNGVIGGWEHFVGIWKLPLRQVKNCRDAVGHKFPGTDKLIFSCTDWSIR